MDGIQREQNGRRGAFFIEQDGKRIAEMTYSGDEAGRVLMIDHTEVDPSLRGQGVPRKLVEAAVAWAREGSKKIVPVCPMASAIFRREKSFADVLAT